MYKASMNHEAFKTYVRGEYEMARAKNPSYSIRACAKRLGLGYGTLSQVLSGKRVLSESTVARVLDRMGASPAQRSAVLKSVLRSGQKFSLIESDEFFVLSEWYYFGILNLIQTKNFKSDSKWIASRLAITKTQVDQALLRLERVGLIKKKLNQWVRTEKRLTTTDQTPNLSVRKTHYQTLDLARTALDELPFEAHDFTWLTLPFHSGCLDEAIKKIREFQDEFLHDFAPQEDADEVYRLGVQFFPVSRKIK